MTHSSSFDAWPRKRKASLCRSVAALCWASARLLAIPVCVLVCVPALRAQNQAQNRAQNPAPAPQPPRPIASPAVPPAASPVSNQPRFVVVLDAAHGGDDSGGRLSTGDSEKSVTLAFSVRLRSLLAARGIPVVTTREEDKSLALADRAQLANRASAQACLILHASETGSGVHLFISSLAPATGAHFAAWKTAQSAAVERSLALAGELNSALTHAGVNVTLSRTTLPGIDSMTCPAVAIELAPERDQSHAILAEPANADYQARIAQTLAAALLEWKTDQGRTGQNSADQGKTDLDRTDQDRTDQGKTEARQP
jgi:N-acetylmuramoyl-L-alanine amidase